MSEKYIRKNKSSYVIVKGSVNFGKFENIEDATFARDILLDANWDLNMIDEIYMVNDTYIALGIIDGKVHILGKFTEEPSADEIDRLTKSVMRNPNNSKYGLNVTKVFDTIIIKKRIAGEDHIFGYYDNLEDAQFVRNFLLDNMWNVNAFSQIEHDSEKDNFKVIEVIDDRVYVLDTFADESEIDIVRCREEFLNRISKHKFGLANHPHLDELTGEISNLESQWNITASDDNWSFENANDPLEMIFSLTPFQKAVYDAVDSSTFDEIKKSLVRYRSGNFDAKIQKNLDELVAMGLVDVRQNCFEKTNL